MVANHLSYLDILLFSAAAPCVFIAKRDIRFWPVFGRLARAAGTIFIHRRSIRDTVRANNEIRKVLQRGVVVVLFAEGTTSPGSSVLTFRSSLLESAIRYGAPITPAHVSYRLPRGRVAQDICYWGDMQFAWHLLNLLAKDGIEGRIQFETAIEALADRKIAANASHAAVVRLSSTAL